MELTKEQVENLVKQPISSFTLNTGSEKGDNVASDLYRLEVTTKSGQIHNLVYKVFPANHPAQREYAIQGQTFRRENIFYSDFTPSLKSLLESKLPEQEIEILVPKFYAGFNDDENDFVCLEDLRPLGFKMADKFKGLDYSETSLTMKKLAQFHAQSYFYLKHEGEGIFERLAPLKIYLQKNWNFADQLLDSEKFLEYKNFFELIYKSTINLIEFSTIKDKDFLVKKMRDNNLMEQVYDLIVSTTNGTDIKYFPLLIHGDFWSNNLLFKYDDKGQVEQVKFLDFQYARRGNIYEDLNYFISTSTTPEFRQSFLTQVLHDYYQAFKGTLQELKCPLPLGWTEGKFMDEFSENILPSYLFLSFALPLQLGEEPEEGKVADEDFTEEVINKMKRSPRAVKRLEEVTREMINLNIL